MVNPIDLAWNIEEEAEEDFFPQQWGERDEIVQNSFLHCLQLKAPHTGLWRSSGGNAWLFRALPLYGFYDAPSPLSDVRSPCQFNCMPFAVNHQDSLQLVSSLFTHIQWLAFSTVIILHHLSSFPNPQFLLDWVPTSLLVCSCSLILCVIECMTDMLTLFIGQD